MSEPNLPMKPIGADESSSSSDVSNLSDAMKLIAASTPARIFVGRAGTAYRTATRLSLRQDHAAALDAVHAEVDLARDFAKDFVVQHQLFEVRTCAASKSEYLMRPDLGRKLDEASRARIANDCQRDVDFQIVIGDGLSAAAVVKQVPMLLPMLADEAARHGWKIGRPFLVQHCRVGVLNDIGDVLNAKVVVLLIGERPGLMTAESLSAYMAFQPKTGQTDADRNLISNIHARGVPIEQAAARIIALAMQMLAMKTSGVSVKEELSDKIEKQSAVPKLDSNQEPNL